MKRNIIMPMNKKKIILKTKRKNININKIIFRIDGDKDKEKGNIIMNIIIAKINISTNYIKEIDLNYYHKNILG